MKLAVSSYEFKDLSFAQILDLLRELEVGYLELWPANVATENLDDVRALRQEAGIQVSCVSAASQYRINAEETAAAQAAIRDAMDLASALGASYVTTYLGDNPRRDFYTTLALYKRDLQPVLDEAAARGITILLENMFDHRGADPQGTKPTRTPQGTRAIYDLIASPHFAITYDPVNFYIAGVEAYPFSYDYLQGCIANVHIKDTKRYSEYLHGDRAGYPIWPDSVTGDYISVPVGQGALPIDTIVRRLQADGYQGFLTIDILTTAADRLRPYRESIAYLKRLMSGEG
ncbi:MAG: sugar phosphate isomerase/epimerase [Ardenticatenaceae bacterium]|nr:sugar phosphate isomerase/epimerase [Ardenticatenaceae bacterium]